MSQSPTARRRYLVTVVGLPVTVVVAGTALAMAVRGSLPDVLASHWGATGVDATQSFTAYVTSAGVAVLGLSALFAVLGWFMPGDGRRWMATMVAAMSGLLGTLFYGLLLRQRGLTDPFTATAPGVMFAAAAGVAALAGWAAWALNPYAPVQPAHRTAPPDDAPTLAADPSERIAWLGHTAGAPWLGWVCLGLVALACFCAVVASPWAALGPGAAIALTVGMMRAKVVVDELGLRVSSGGILTWLTVPMAQVGYAEPSSLTAFREFGGLGMRYRKGARAFVTRSGEALLVVHQDGTRSYVSMDASDEAASVLNTLARRLAIH